MFVFSLLIAESRMEKYSTNSYLTPENFEIFNSSTFKIPHYDFSPLALCPYMVDVINIVLNLK